MHAVMCACVHTHTLIPLHKHKISFKTVACDGITILSSKYDATFHILLRPFSGPLGYGARSGQGLRADRASELVGQ